MFLFIVVSNWYKFYRSHLYKHILFYGIVFRQCRNYLIITNKIKYYFKVFKIFQLLNREAFAIHYFTSRFFLATQPSLVDFLIRGETTKVGKRSTTKLSDGTDVYVANANQEDLKQAVGVDATLVVNSCLIFLNFCCHTFYFISCI